jgi:hypothetical protein
VCEVLRRPLYRGEVIWNQTKKRDTWGRKRQQARGAADWIQHDRPDLRIVSEDLWRLAHARLDGAREDYVRRNAGRVWGRLTNATESKYLLTGLAQCAWCNGFIVAPTGHAAGTSTPCAIYHLRGREVCANQQLLPMELTNDSVLDMFRSDLLNPQALERALSKLEARLTMAPDDACVSAIETEQRRLQSELAQLTAP